MSIDVRIIPTLSQIPTWGDIRERWLNDEMPSEGRGLLGHEPRLHKYGTHVEVEPTERLATEGHYFFGLPEDNTLSFHVHPIIDADDARAFVEDIAINLGSEDKEAWIRAWNNAGFSYSVESFGGRHEFEMYLFVSLAAVVSELSSGMIMVNDEGCFDLPVGLYPASIFHNAGHSWYRWLLGLGNRSNG